MAENDEIKYSDAIQELESIVRKMQSECSIDELSAYTKRALQLLKACRTKLTAVDEELKNVLKEIEKAD